MTAMNDFVSEFVDQSIRRIEENTPRILKCLDELSEEDMWKRPNNSSNSVGNIILHICGNVTQYIIAALGDTEDRRDRDNEFSATGGATRQELILKLTGTVSHAVNIIKQQTEESLSKKRMVQGYDLTGVGIIIHVLEHYSYHTGQIVFWTKLLKDKDLVFYGTRNLNIRNTI